MAENKTLLAAGGTKLQSKSAFVNVMDLRVRIKLEREREAETMIKLKNAENQISCKREFELNYSKIQLYSSFYPYLILKRLKN